MNALLVYPKFPPTYWSFAYALKFVGKKCLLPPLPLITVASMLPQHWKPKLVDLNIEPLSDHELRRADLVLLTGMMVQRESLHEVLRRCRRIGVPTLVGGPYVTGEPHLLDDADYLFLGEGEDAIPRFIEAFEAGTAPRTTHGTEKPDLTRSPVPRYDLLRRGAYQHMSLQYSRGCPFSCEFCDIIVMFGRNPRTKTAPQVLAELEAIHATGFRGSVFFVDDNFIGNKKAVRSLLPALRTWQERRRRPFSFYTEASLNIAEDSALMNAMTGAGFNKVFIGIESPSPEALAETKKNQNIKGEIVDRVHEVLRHGLDVTAGFIVGFDSDRPDIFDRQIEFIEFAAIPDAMVGILHALPGTPLLARLREEGRLRPATSTDQFGRTNFETMIPEPILLSGYKRIIETIYEPRHYLARVLELMRRKGDAGPRERVGIRDIVAGCRAITTQGILGSYRSDYWRFLREVCRWKPSRLTEAITRAAIGHHFIEYTRRVVSPRLAEQMGSTLAVATSVLPAEAAGGGR